MHKNKTYTVNRDKLVLQNKIREELFSEKRKVLSKMASARKRKSRDFRIEIHDSRWQHVIEEKISQRKLRKE